MCDVHPNAEDSIELITYSDTPIYTSMWAIVRDTEERQGSIRTSKFLQCLEFMPRLQCKCGLWYNANHKDRHNGVCRLRT